MILQGENILLVPYTLEHCHEVYKQYIPDPMMTEEAFNYNKERIDLYYQNKVLDATRVFFAISYRDTIIGEIQLKRMGAVNKCATLSIILTNDAVKNKGFGTEAEKLLITYAFHQLGMDTIYADAVHRNLRSRHVLEKIGFEHTHDDEILSYYKLEKEKYDNPIQMIEIHEGNRSAVVNAISDNWGSNIIVTKGKIHRAEELPGFLAIEHGNIIGIITYHISEKECEIVSLDSFSENRGTGTLLIKHLISTAREKGCQRVFLITTNDNTRAIRFYQKRGFDLAAIHRNAISESRKIKPQIPLTGFDGIPILHELEFEMILER